MVDNSISEGMEEKMTKEAKLFFWIAVFFMIVGVITESRMIAFKQKTEKEITAIYSKIKETSIIPEHRHNGIGGKVVR